VLRPSRPGVCSSTARREAPAKIRLSIATFATEWHRLAVAATGVTGTQRSDLRQVGHNTASSIDTVVALPPKDDGGPAKIGHFLGLFPRSVKPVR